MGKLYRKELEAEHGPLVSIPPKKLKAIKAMTVADRVAWYGNQQAKKAERKRERAARKRGRRERSR